MQFDTPIQMTGKDYPKENMNTKKKKNNGHQNKKTRRRTL